MKSLSARQLGLLFLVVTSIGWGLNYPLIKILLREWPPLAARGIAGLVAAAALMLMAAWRNETLRVPRTVLSRLFAEAVLSVFAWMGFSTLAMRWLSAGEVALVVYTMPIWATLLAWPFRGEPPTVARLTALSLGVAGMVVLFSESVATFGGEKLPGMALALAAAVLFAIGAVAWRTPLPLPPLVAVAWRVGIGCLPMLAIDLLLGATLAPLSGMGWATLAYMALVPMGLCYLTWFAALSHLPPTTASMATLLTPVIGVVAAAIVLGEPLGARQIAALALTLAGVGLALRAGRIPSMSR
jgi:drug/metabolite transporter (DMT)-like permease